MCNSVCAMSMCLLESPMSYSFRCTFSEAFCQLSTSLLEINKMSAVQSFAWVLFTILFFSYGRQQSPFFN